LTKGKTVYIEVVRTLCLL